MVNIAPERQPSGPTSREVESPPSPQITMEVLNFGPLTAIRGEWYPGKTQAEYLAEVEDIFVHALLDLAQKPVAERPAMTGDAADLLAYLALDSRFETSGSPEVIIRNALREHPQWQTFTKSLTSYVTGTGFTHAHHGDPEVDPFGEAFQQLQINRCLELIKVAVESRGWGGQVLDRISISSMTMTDSSRHQVETALAQMGIRLKDNIAVTITRMACVSGHLNLLDANMQAIENDEGERAGGNPVESKVIVLAIEDISGTPINKKPDLHNFASAENNATFLTYWTFGAGAVVFAGDPHRYSQLVVEPSAYVLLNNPEQPVMKMPNAAAWEDVQHRSSRQPAPLWLTVSPSAQNQIIFDAQGIEARMTAATHVELSGEAARLQFSSYGPLIILEQFLKAAITGQVPELIVCHQANKTIVNGLEKRTKGILTYLQSLSPAELADLKQVLSQATAEPELQQAKEIFENLYDKDRAQKLGFAKAKVTLKDFPKDFLDLPEFLAIFQKVVGLYEELLIAYSEQTPEQAQSLNRALSPLGLQIPAFPWVIDQIQLNNISGPTLPAAPHKLMETGVIQPGMVVEYCGYAVGEASGLIASTEVWLGPPEPLSRETITQPLTQTT